MAHKTGWYVVEENKFPRGSGPCTFCKKTPKENEVVYVKTVNVQTSDYDHYRGKFRVLTKNVIMHKWCLEGLVARAPADPISKWDEIRGHLIAGGDLFDVG